jgi:hypothetical protein
MSDKFLQALEWVQVKLRVNLPFTQLGKMNLGVSRGVKHRNQHPKSFTQIKLTPVRAADLESALEHAGDAGKFCELYAD